MLQRPGANWVSDKEGGNPFFFYVHLWLSKTFPTSLTWISYYKDIRKIEITAVKAMEELGLKKTTFYKLVKEYEEVAQE
jgi:hypothetical protein